MVRTLQPTLNNFSLSVNSDWMKHHSHKKSWLKKQTYRKIMTNDSAAINQKQATHI